MDLNEINKHLLVAEEQINKLKEGKKVSATHARQALLQIKKLTDILRKEILQYVKDLKPKKAETPAVETPEETPPII